MDDKFGKGHSTFFFLWNLTEAPLNTLDARML